MKKKTKEALLEALTQLNSLASDNAASHFDAEALGVTEDQVSPGYDFNQLIYEALHSEAQHEYEGLMWGWQDCVQALKEIVKEL